VLPLDLGHESLSKNWSRWLPDGENRTILRLLVLTHYQRVIDGQTDGHAACVSRCSKSATMKPRVAAQVGECNYLPVLRYVHAQ